MVSEFSSRRQQLADYFHSRGVLFWAVSISVVTTTALFAGSQIARTRGRDVEWYAGFGQWIGALASFVAAGSALWISVSDRRFAMAERQRVEAQHDADLTRQAGLVQITAGIMGKPQIGGHSRSAAVAVRNRRSERIFDLAVVRFVHSGGESELLPATVNGFYIYPPRDQGPVTSAALPGLVLTPDELLVIYQQQSLPNTPADYVAVRYTDSAGRRWEVDTDGGVTRL